MRFLILITVLFFSLSPVQAEEAKEPVKIGFVYSYIAVPHYLGRGRRGAELAVEEFNEAGGFQGRSVEMIFRDDRANPSDGLQVVSDLVDREKVVILTGMSFSSVSKAIYQYAQQHKIPYFAGWCASDVCTKTDDPYVFSFEEPYDVSAHKMAAKAASYDIKKWAILRHADTWDMAISKPFQEELKRLRPDAEIVAEIIAPFGQAEGNVIANTLRIKGAEGVYVTFVGSSLANYIRYQNQRGTMDAYKHIAAFLPPEELDFLGEEAPKGWYALSYPSRQLDTPDHIAFIEAYAAKHEGQEPGMNGIMGYVTAKLTLEALRKADTLDRKAIVNAAQGLTIDTPVGLMTMQEKDHRSDFNYWYGYIDIKDGKPIMVDFERNTAGAE